MFWYFNLITSLITVNLLFLWLKILIEKTSVTNLILIIYQQTLPQSILIKDGHISSSRKFMLGIATENNPTLENINL